MGSAPLTLTLLFGLLGGSDAIRLESTAPVHPGDVLTLHGRLNPRQLQNAALYIGDMRTGYENIDDNTIQFVVPPIPAGRHDVALRRGSVDLFRHSIEVATTSDQVLGRASGTLTSEGGTLSIGDTVSVSVPPEAGRRRFSISLEHLRSETEIAYLRDAFLNSENLTGLHLPPITADSVVIITSADQLPEFLNLRVTVPATFVEKLPAGYEPEIYALRADEGANDEVIPQYEMLRAAWETQSRSLTAPLPTSFFWENERFRAGTAPGTSTIIAVCVRKVE